jgi:hypothetical protein
LKIIRIIISVLIICGIASLFLFSGGNSDANTIVENSPYPEFIYAGSSAVSLIVSHNSGKDIPSFLFNFIDGVYTNAEHPEQMAIKTPIWFVAKLMSNENMNAEDGYIFVNSHYVGKPDTIYAKYITYTDAIIYSNEYIMGMKLYDDYTDVEMIIPNSADDVDTLMLSGLKSIGGIKVIQSNIENREGNVVVVNMRLDAPLEQILNYGFNMDYVPIEVSVDGWDRKDQYTYTRGRYDKLYVQVLPVNEETMKKIIKKQMGMQNLKEMSSYNGWDVEEYTSTLGNGYICCKELEYGTVCVITNNLIYLNDVSISELK